MKIAGMNGKGEAEVTIVCCLHGDEIFGLKVFKYFSAHLREYPGVRLVLANEPALKAGKRFVDQDLNRSFPGKKAGNREERLAKKILQAVGKTAYLLDVHTTTSDILMTPIVASLNKRVRNIINVCSSREVAHMGRGLSAKSLIGCYADAAASLEFNEKYARTASAFAEMRRIVDGLVHRRSRPASARRIYYINGIIPKDLVRLPKGTSNFKRIRGLGVYPFLLYEKSYKDIYGFSAERVTRKKI